MNKVLIFLFLFGYFANCYAKSTDKGKDKEAEQPLTYSPAVSPSDLNPRLFIGEWKDKGNNKTYGDYTFSLSFKLGKNNTVLGKYCSIMYNGNRDDCFLDDDDYNMQGVIKGDTLFLGFYGHRKTDKGTAKVYLKEGKLMWRLLTVHGRFDLPLKSELSKVESNQNSLMTSVQADNDDGLSNKSLLEIVKKKITLPFDFLDYEKAMDLYAENGEESVRYDNEVFLCDYTDLMQFYLCDTDNSMPFSLNRIATGKDFDLDVVRYNIAEKPSLICKLYTSKNGKYIDELTVIYVTGKEAEGNWYRHTFNIDENLNITIHRNTVAVASDKVTARKVIGLYHITADGYFQKE